MELIPNNKQGAVIGCHAKEELDAHLAKAKEAGKLVIIDFFATWCGPCQEIAPVYAKYAKMFPAAVFLKVDVVDELPEVADSYKITGIPTFVFIKNGETVETLRGPNKDVLLETIKKYVGAPPSASA